MAAGNSNTFVLPSQGSSIAVSRTQFNSSLKAVLQNFYSSGTPGTDNLIDSGSSISSGDYDGMLFRNSSTGMFYVSDSSITTASGRTNRPVGGNFTRYGIAWRQQGSLTAAEANISTFDVGEAFVVVKDTAGASNNRMYLRVATTGTFTNDFVDIGQPAPGQVTAASLTNYSISGQILANTLGRSTELTFIPRVVIETYANTQNSSTTAALEVKGSSVSNVSIGFTTGTNSSMIKQVSSNPGLAVESTNGIHAPIRSNSFLQTTITGSSTNQAVAVLIPAGVIVAWAGSSAPDGWLICDGTEVLKATYPALSTVCGSTFGSTSGTVFNIPNLQGRAIYGTSSSITRGSTSTAIGSSFGVTLSGGSTGSAGGHNHSTTSVSVNSTSDKDVAATVTVLTGISAAADHTHSTSSTLTAPGISLNYIIKT